MVSTVYIKSGIKEEVELPREIPAEDIEQRTHTEASQEGASGSLHALEACINGLHGRDSLQLKALAEQAYAELSSARGHEAGRGLRAHLSPKECALVLEAVGGLDGKELPGLNEILSRLKPDMKPTEVAIDVEKSVSDSSPPGAATPSTSIPTINAKEAISAFLEERKFRNCSPKTLYNYSHFLPRFIGQFSQVPTDHKLIRGLLNNYKGKTKETYWLYFSAFYGFLEKEYGLLNPLARLTPPHEPKGMPSHLNPEQKVRLAEINLNPRDRALVNLFCESALRPGEVLDSHGHPLRFCDIYEDHIRVSGKRGERIVPITPQSRDGLLSLQGSRPADSAVFTRDDDHALTYWGLRKIVGTAFKKAGITGVKLCPYTLRHSFGGDFLARGGDLATLQKILGHANVKTTMIYTHIADTQVMDSYRQHGPSAINSPLIAPVAGGKFPVNSDPSQQLPELLDRLIAMGQQAQELKQSLGGNGHWPEQLNEVKKCLKHLSQK
ncbi:MAG: tyrosine-type recombinase/integrase [Desulfobacterales bacterium]|nr:tyrosine-type recombinase/integrase [Desulfobacterales bacterium]